MIRRRPTAAEIAAPVGCHSFRATGITAYLMNGGTLEHAQAMAAHESARTTKLYDRTRGRLTQDEVERTGSQSLCFFSAAAHSDTGCRSCLMEATKGVRGSPIIGICRFLSPLGLSGLAHV